VNRSKALSTTIIALSFFVASVGYGTVQEYDMGNAAWDSIKAANQIPEYGISLGLLNLQPLPTRFIESVRSSKWGSTELSPGHCVWIYHGPNPYSIFRFIMVAECTTSILHVVQSADGAAGDTISVLNLLPGWYGVSGNLGFPSHPSKWQIISAGEVINEWQVGVFK
jgi:hypothetical protein